MVMQSQMVDNALSSATLNGYCRPCNQKGGHKGLLASSNVVSGYVEKKLGGTGS